jgi:L-threonylcarbamoyladenylate synthase
LDQHIRDQVDLVIDAGRLPGGEGSTVVDVTVNPPKIIREGAIRAAKIHVVLEGA